ncbi:MAG: ankyrin repeat domain-containing protein [bacterium]|jgi:ankyrin repeat protein
MSDENLISALHYGGDNAYAKVKDSLDMGANVEARENLDRGHTALILASTGSHPEIVSLLLSKGAKIEARDHNSLGIGQQTPLMHAAGCAKNPEIVKLLLEKGAKIKAKDNFGSTPLFMAASHSDTPEIAKLLLDKGAKINAKNNLGRTPLMEACQGESTKMITFLLENGAKINTKDKIGMTPLMHACSVWGISSSPGSWDLCFDYAAEIVSLLLKKGANARARDHAFKRAIDHYKENTEFNNLVTLQELTKASEGWWPFW